ncbi:chromatin silencing protein Clr2 [Schizosaccharomyces japonicus yFS275]|uniref:Chromatin silencing protein Clr2 n=1 Tax=Schizosaccharomyces japonicus (strain yFS275 / FY16936) TaxID=402676 RepID=B6K156_SCHJY|nr:chromatin silencing protein Clr2 [Schizosaccharomyces japonicus yFS275]EEB07677.2 chromatin silencing protein Clr2 [Schizosaccharomyces japonicus yFS275]
MQCGKMLAKHVFGGSGTTQAALHIFEQYEDDVSPVSPMITNTPVKEGDPLDMLTSRKTSFSQKTPEKAPVKHLNTEVKGLPTDASFDNYVLGELPQNYELFVKVGARNNTSAKADLWLFGHPSGRPFRSAVEFQPHLYWLVTDLTHDVQKCCCVLCSNQDTKSRRSQQMEAERLYHECKDDTYTWPASFRLGELIWVDMNGQMLPGIVVSRNLLTVENRSNVEDHLMLKDSYLEPYQYHCRELGNSRYFFNMVAADVEPWVSRKPDPSNKSHALGIELTKSWCLFGCYQPLDESQYIEHESNRAPRCVLPILEEASSETNDHYYGLFLGAEKIWVNDLCALHEESLPENFKETSFMHISDIYINDADIICVRGTLWKVIAEENDRHSASEKQENEKQLPRRLSMISMCVGMTFVRLHAPEDEYECELANIKGRWYEPWMLHGPVCETEMPSLRVNSRLEAIQEENWVNSNFYELLSSEIENITPVVM